MQPLLADLDALCITNPLNIRYLTGFVGLAPEEREAYVVVTHTKLYLFTTALYLEQATQLSNNPIIKLSNYPIQELKVVEISREEPLTKKIKEVLKSSGSAGLRHTIRLGFEQNDITFTEYKNLETALVSYSSIRQLAERSSLPIKSGSNNKSLVKLVPTQNRVETLRQIKRPDEIKNIRHAAKLTDDCFTQIVKRLKPGMTESEIAWEIESFFRKNSAGSAFPPIVAFNANSSQPHYQSSDVRLQSSALVLLDFGAKVEGYCADMTRVIFLGKPTDTQKLVYETVLKSQQAAIDALYSSNEDPSDGSSEKLKNSSLPIKSGSNNITISGAKLDQAARNIIAKAKLPTYPHSLGHSLGLAIHEGPRLSAKREEFLTPGMVFTIEPGIYLPGEFGVRIEDLILLKEDGIEILSKSPKNLIIV